MAQIVETIKLADEETDKRCQKQTLRILLAKAR